MIRPVLSSPPATFHVEPNEVARKLIAALLVASLSIVGAPHVFAGVDFECETVSM